MYLNANLLFKNKKRLHSTVCTVSDSLLSDLKEQFRVFRVSHNLCVNNEKEINRGTLQKTKADFTLLLLSSLSGPPLLLS